MPRRRRYRRRRRPGRLWITGSVAIVAGIWAYAQFLSPVLEDSTSPPAADAQTTPAEATDPPANNAAPGPRLTSTRPESPGPTGNERISEKGALDAKTYRTPKTAESAERAAKLFAAGMTELAKDNLLAARQHLSEAVTLDLAGNDLIEARAALVRIGKETVFNGAILPDDPLVRRHVVSPNETLGRIAAKYDVTADLLAALNNIRDKNMIQLGQTLKVVQGPFHVRVDKQTYRMDVYLQDTFVRQYQVGLGANDSTPLGEWIVGSKIVRPTYYPPRGGQIIAADDPQNPLGGYWIELVGISGHAKGQQRYGIHGTIAPESIGKSESLGCIRMHNQDVAEVFTLLVSKKSHVWVQ